MAGNTTNVSIRIDADLKAQADALFAELGMNYPQHLTSSYANRSVKAEFPLK